MNINEDDDLIMALRKIVHDMVDYHIFNPIDDVIDRSLNNESGLCGARALVLHASS